MCQCFDVKRETELKLLAATAQTCTTRTTRASEAESVIKHLRDELNQNVRHLMTWLLFSRDRRHFIV